MEAMASWSAMPRSVPSRSLYLPLRARAQSSASDEGRSKVSMVDANLGVLKERIEKLRMEKRLERCRPGGSEGWNYRSNYDGKLRNRGNRVLAEAIEVTELAFGTAGLTILGCTLCLCFVSILVHLSC